MSEEDDLIANVRVLGSPLPLELQFLVQDFREAPDDLKEAAAVRMALAVPDARFTLPPDVALYVKQALGQYAEGKPHRRAVGKLETAERWQRAASLVGWYAGLFELPEAEAADLAVAELKETPGTIRRQVGDKANREAFDHWRARGREARKAWTAKQLAAHLDAIRNRNT